MTHLLQHILVIFTVFLLIVTVFFPTSNQAQTSEITSNKMLPLEICQNRMLPIVEEISILEQTNQPTQEVDLPTRMTSVEQISDVSPSDPYFKALKSLIEQYQIDVTLPDGSFRGAQPITRGDLVIYLRNSLELIVIFQERSRIFSLDFDEKQASEYLIRSIEDCSDIISQKIEHVKTRLDDLESKINQSEQSLFIKLVAALVSNKGTEPIPNSSQESSREEEAGKRTRQKFLPLLAQVNSIEEIPDVSSNDYYYEALREIIENYKVDVTLPDGTFKGNQPITRGEVIIYLNDTITTLEELIAPEEAEARERELKIRLAHLSSQIAQEDSDFTEKFAQIEEIEAQLDELENWI
ncbi:MAG: S-layer homology domain-containing protein [Symploca sp. SIO2C1]|nr:S-layer homology domain-containing protein [Symploca sp. SIO2C1]